MGRLRLRSGLAVLTVVAVLAVLAVGVPAWWEDWTRWRDGGAPPAVAPALERADGALRDEAERSIRYLVDGEAGARAALTRARIRTDRAVRRLRARATDAPIAVRAATAGLVADWSRWQTARAGIDRRTTSDDRALEQLRRLTTDPAFVADALAGLRGAAGADRRATARLSRARAALADQQRDLTVALSRVTITPAMLASLRAVPGTLGATLDPARSQLARSGVDFAGFDRAHARTTPLARIARSGIVPFWTASDWQRRAATEQAELDTLVRRTLRRSSAAEAAARADRRDALRTSTLLLIAAIALVVVTGIVLARRIRRPVTAPTLAVVDTAEPRATPDRPTTATGRPPGESPVVTLVRRNEPLLDRQLALLDEIEATETDPRRRQSLLEVDQLGARIRRNGERLLVVAGLDPERLDASAMTPVDLVRAAVGEIEHFARIDVAGLPDDVTMTGAAARDLVHVLAELLDNAATFSAPDTRVSVRARPRADDLEITVSDEGIGIPVARLDEYNELLAHPPPPAPDPAGELGLVIAARSGERIGATVRLRSAPDAGTSAVVTVPARLLQPAARRPDPVGAPEAAATPSDTPPSAPPDDGVHFTAVPIASPGDLLAGDVARSANRRARRRPSTGTLHRAPAPRRTEAAPMSGND